MGYHKYRNVITTVDNIKFHSAAESRYYVQLKALLQNGRICNLDLQPKFEIVPKYKNGNGEKIQAAYYVADFRYVDMDSGENVIVDVKRKQTATDTYRLKKKLFEKIYYPLTVNEVDC